VHDAPRFILVFSLNYVFFVIFSDFKVIFEVTGVIKNRSYSECKK
jgi:hypothetical protein